MSYWDSSALVKLYVQELDSTEFRELAVNASRVATGSLTRHEVRTVFRRREAEGVLPSGEAAALYDELTADIAAADIVIQPETADMEREFGTVLEACFSQKPPTFIRTNDALHLASAKVAGELEFITADMRQRAAAMLMGFTCCLSALFVCFSSSSSGGIHPPTMATAAARSRLRINTHSNVELKCYPRSRNLKKPRKRIDSEKESYGKLPYNRHVTLA